MMAESYPKKKNQKKTSLLLFYLESGWHDSRESSIRVCKACFNCIGDNAYDLLKCSLCGDFKRQQIYC